VPKRPQLEGIAVDDILDILTQLSEQDAVDAITEAIAARFDGQSLAQIVAGLTNLRDWEHGSKTIAGAGNDR
jgi:hypothetical protein